MDSNLGFPAQKPCSAATIKRPTVLALVLQPQIWTEKVKAAVVVAAAGSGLMSPPPPGTRQYRFLRRVRLPDQMVEEPVDLGNCHGNQGFIPFRLSPFLLLQTAFACCLTTAK